MSDEDFKTTVAVLRLALPYTGMILSTRETAEMRDEVINLGISQISAGSRTNPGGYHESEVNDQYTEQFTIYDSRSLEQIVGTLADMGLMPSMCTACYRVGRTGERFMEEAKSGHIHVYCLPNAILTFKEYLMDFGTTETRAAGEKLIAEQIQKVEEPRMRKALHEKLQRMDQGERDLYF
jgi:2-iminoacetate synthase